MTRNTAKAAPTGRAAKPRGAAATSLVPSPQTLPRKEAPSDCPFGPPDMRLFCLETGEVRPVPCGRLVCPYCVVRAAWRRSLAIAYARPERFVTLTLVGDEWPVIRGRVYRLRYELVAVLGVLVQWVWTVERNPRGTGHHVHAWQRGDFLPQAKLSKLARRCGMGQTVDVRRWTGGGESYALKEAYALKDADSTGYYLAMNGGRLTHQSREFFGGPVREVEKAAVAEKLGPDRDRWIVTSVAELDRAFAKAPR